MPSLEERFFELNRELVHILECYERYLEKAREYHEDCMKEADEQDTYRYQLAIENGKDELEQTRMRIDEEESLYKIMKEVTNKTND